MSTIDKVAHDSRKEIAADLGWSTGKVAMADVVNKRAPEEVKEKLAKGEMSVNEAYVICPVTSAISRKK